jgi:hypothetical protein
VWSLLLKALPDGLTYALKRFTRDRAYFVNWTPTAYAVLRFVSA